MKTLKKLYKKAITDLSFKITILLSWAFVGTVSYFLIEIEPLFLFFAAPFYVLLNYLTVTTFFNVRDLRWFILSSLLAAWLVFLFVAYSVILNLGIGSLAFLPMYLSFYKFSLRVIGQLKQPIKTLKIETFS